MAQDLQTIQNYPHIKYFPVHKIPSNSITENEAQKLIEDTLNKAKIQDNKGHLQ